MRNIKKYVCISISFFAFTAIDSKNILILTSKGGGAHAAATKVIQEAIGATHNLFIVNALTDIFKTFGTVGLDAEDFFNFLIKNNLNYIMNIVQGVGLVFIKMMQPLWERDLETFIADKKIDEIISVMPVVNSSVLAVCKRHNIPFLLIPLDIDLSIYFPNRHADVFEKFYLSLPFKNQFLDIQVHDLHIDSSRIVYLGFPLRNSFWKPKNNQQIMKDFNLPSNKKKILIIMGGKGSRRSLYYLQRFMAYVHHDIHVILCIGSNDELLAKIQQLQFPRGSTTTYSVIGFTERIADLMAVSDVLITKSGPTSLFEAIQMKIPILVDAITDVLDWEKPNIYLVDHFGIGYTLRNPWQLYGYIDELLFNESEIQRIKKNLDSITLKNFVQEFKKFIEHH